MRLKKIKAGHYVSLDGRVDIKRHIADPQHSLCVVCWTLRINGIWKNEYDTRREAILAVKRYHTLPPK